MKPDIIIKKQNVAPKQRVAYKKTIYRFIKNPAIMVTTFGFNLFFAVVL